MATNNTGKKILKWSQADEDRLIYNVEKHVICLRKAFDITSKETQRSSKAVQAHWYQRTSKNCGRTLFATVSSSHIAINRKNGKGQPLKLSLYRRILALLGLSY